MLEPLGSPWHRRLLPWRWYDVGYLLVSFVTGTISFTWAVAAGTTAIALSVFVIGLPVALLVVGFDRWWCDLERGRAGRVLGRAVPSGYRPRYGDGPIRRGLSVFGDRQVWLDLVWMLLAFPLGLIGFLLVTLLASAVLALLSGPIWLWSIPDWIHRHDVALSILFPLLAVPAAAASAVLVRGYAVLKARAAEALLAPRRTELLEARVQTLAESRAGAVDASVTDLQRVERDLHDGAQARLVALAMDLGMAEQRLAGADPDAAASTSPTLAIRRARRSPTSGTSSAGSDRASSPTAASTQR